MSKNKKKLHKKMTATLALKPQSIFISEEHEQLNQFKMN